MNLLPIKYKQPTDSSDARCALYALANLFDDHGFLFFTNVGESTGHNREVEILIKYSQIAPVFEKIKIRTIYPHAITPPEIQIHYCEDFNICTEAGKYIPVLVDIASNEANVYHTVLVLWGDVDCIVIDSKKDFPEPMGHTTLFERAKVHGFRILTGSEPDKHGDISMVLLSPSDLPHIFGK